MRAHFGFQYGTSVATAATTSPKTQAVDSVLQGPRALGLANRWRLKIC